MTTACVRLDRNNKGRDLVIGDLHGMISLLESELERVGFDTAADRLICVGDLVDRGPESYRVPQLLREPWCYSVLGNHDVHLLIGTKYFSVDRRIRDWLIGGDFEWWRALDAEARAEMQAALGALPWLIEIDTDVGLVGIVHAQVPDTVRSWAELRALVERSLKEVDVDPLWPLVWRSCYAAEPVDRVGPPTPEHAEWEDTHYRLPDVAHVIHGHHIDDAYKLTRLANRYYIDTGAFLILPRYQPHLPPWANPRLTIVDARRPWIAL